MPTVHTRFLQCAALAIRECYLRQLHFLTTANRLSSQIREQVGGLYLELTRLRRLSPFPSVADADITAIEAVGTQAKQAADQNELNGIMTSLLKKLEAIGPASDDALPTTTNDLNKRMIDLLGQLKQKVRFTARRHNDAGGNYDKTAFVALRNQIYLSRHLYLEQLDHDLLQATNEDCAELEQRIYPDIVDSSAGTFLTKLSVLEQFLRQRVASLTLGPNPASPTHDT